MELREDGGGRERGKRDGSIEGDAELINVCCTGSVTTLMLIEFEVIGPSSFMEGVSVS